MEVFGVWGGFCQAKTNPIKANLFVLRAAYCVLLGNPYGLRIAKRNLKKQSQFADGQNGVNSFQKGDYGDNPPCGARKNKAKQSQFQVVDA